MGPFRFRFFSGPPPTQVVQGQEETRRRGDIYSSLSRFVGGAPTQNVARRLGQTRSPDLSSFNLALSLPLSSLSLSAFFLFSNFKQKRKRERGKNSLESRRKFFWGPPLILLYFLFPGRPPRGLSQPISARSFRLLLFFPRGLRRKVKIAPS